MEGLGQGGQDREKVHWAQNGHSRQELWAARLDSLLPRQWRRVDQYVRRNFHHRSLACNNIHYPFYMQSLASHPALTPVPAILYRRSIKEAVEKEKEVGPYLKFLRDSEPELAIVRVKADARHGSDTKSRAPCRSRAVESVLMIGLGSFSVSASQKTIGFGQRLKITREMSVGL